MKSAGWNPLLQLKPDKPNFASHAMCIADAIVEKSGGDGGEQQVFRDKRAKSACRRSIMWERMTIRDNANLRNIPRLLTAPDTYDPETNELNGGFFFTLQRMAAVRQRRRSATRPVGVLMRLNDKNSQSTTVRDVIETLKSHFAILCG